ncbi:MAG: bacteriophage abortive infection AbiH family protein [Bacteroides intestinalis]|nr:bacteriophage abortive infection AbiH family protein [Bacteroides intestinalis]
MNIVYLIGNGFDINLGLKTQYCDFYSYYIQSPHSDKSNPNIGKLKDELKSFLQKDPELCCQKEYVKWADLEIALGKYTKEFNSIDDFQAIYYDLYDNLADYIEQEEARITNYENFTQLNKDFISPERHLPLLDSNTIQDYNKGWENYSQWNIDIITFNYTSTIEKLLGYQNKQLSLGNNRFGHPVYVNSIKHIHGTVNEHMLLGVNDISQISNESLKDNSRLQNIIMKPQTNRMLKGLIDSQCENIIRSSNLICLFGLSLGDTDNIWWELIGKQLKRADFRIIYFVKGSEISRRRFHLIGDKEVELKEYLLSKSGLTAEEKSSALDKIFIGYNTKIFHLNKK